MAESTKNKRNFDNATTIVVKSSKLIRELSKMNFCWLIRWQSMTDQKIKS